MSDSKTVIVTGSSSGIGTAIAKAFFDRGDNVVIHGRSEEKLKAVAASLGDSKRVAWVASPLEDLSTGEQLVAAAVDRFGSVDVLVNNAGTFGMKPFFDVTEADLDGYINGNLKGTYFISQAISRHMAEQGGGGIVNIGTVMVNHGVSGAPVSAPVVTKGAIHTLTVLLSAELASQNIRVNLVAPGIIRTPLHSGMEVDELSGWALLNRVGESEEIAEAVMHLADAEFTTGVILPVDGGYISGRP